jgi:hypothetical protein
MQAPGHGQQRRQQLGVGYCRDIAGGRPFHIGLAWLEGGDVKAITASQPLVGRGHAAQDFQALAMVMGMALGPDRARAPLRPLQQQHLHRRAGPRAGKAQGIEPCLNPVKRRRRHLH